MTLLLVAALLVPASGQNASEDEPGWTNLNPDLRPPALSGHAMTYDSGADRVILFGGAQTWSYDFNDNTWTDLSPAEAPLGRFNHALAYDIESERVILYGGDLGTRAGEGRADTWSYDSNANTWTNVTPDLSPPRRDATALAYDSESDRIILFGGKTPPGNFPQNDTWAYDTNTNTWTKMHPVVRPSERCCHAMAYDAESDRVILFGGSTNALIHRADDTWSYDFNADTWTEMTPDPSPARRRSHAMTYDSQADRTILFGGGTSNGVPWTNETWSYHLNRNQWTNLTPARSPSIRSSMALAYDTESTRVILFAGNIPGPRSNETWSFLYALPAPDFFNPFVAVVASALLVGLAIVVLWGRRQTRRTG
ncbi:MAG: kelch repeat-containing protein [Thermoplasmata archaeon]